MLPLFLSLSLLGGGCSHTQTRADTQASAEAPPAEDTSGADTPGDTPGDSSTAQDSEPSPAGEDSSSEGQAEDSASSGTRVWRELRYAPPKGGDPELATLDLFRPDDEQNRPLVLLIHGGSWVGGDKSNFEIQAPSFIPWWIDRGYVVAAVNFRLATPKGRALEVRPRDQAEDIAHALAWLLSQADSYQIDPEEVLALGYSSGAHLVALLGADGQLLEGAGLEETVLDATLSLDVHAYDVPYALELMEGSVRAKKIPFIEHLFGTSEEVQLLSSPIHYKEGWVAPALLISVDQDPAEEGSYGYLVFETAAHYAAALREQGHTAWTFHDEEENHTTLATGFGEPDDLVTSKVAEFLDQLP